MHDASAVIRRFTHLAAALCGAVCCVAAAQDEDSGIPPLRDLPPLEGDIPQLGDAGTEETLPAAPTQNAETVELIRKGIFLQKELLEVLRSITDKTTADAASKHILRLATDLRVWGAALDTRPMEDEIIMGEYEREYLPLIDQFNREIRKESERLLTYRYFESTRLAQALVELVRQAQ